MSGIADALLSRGYTLQHFLVEYVSGVETLTGWYHPDPRPTGEQIAQWSAEYAIAETISAINAEAYRRIVAIAPEYKQRNMMARSIELQNKLIAGQQWTTDEQAEVAAMQAVWDQIKAIRAAANTMTADPAAYTQPESWIF